MQVVSTGLQTIDDGSRSINRGKVGHSIGFVFLGYTVGSLGANQANYIGVSFVQSVATILTLGEGGNSFRDAQGKLCASQNGGRIGGILKCVLLNLDGVGAGSGGAGVGSAVAVLIRAVLVFDLCLVLVASITHNGVLVQGSRVGHLDIGTGGVLSGALSLSGSPDKKMGKKNPPKRSA